MTAAERLDAIAARADAATEGPWRTREHGYGTGIEGPVEDEQLIVETYGLTYPVNPADAVFIAHARTDVPALVAALRAVLDLHQPQRPTSQWDLVSWDACSCGAMATTTAVDGMPSIGPVAHADCPTVRAITTALGGRP